MSLGFSNSIFYSNLYYYSVCDERIILMTYSESLVGYKLALNYDFDIKDMSMMHYFLEKKYESGSMIFS
jgi:hypothetical protein